MLNKVAAFIRQHNLLQAGDKVICGVSGGADSVALLLALYLLKDKLNVTLAAAHYNHGLRGRESDADQAFVEELCGRYDIPLQIGRGQVSPGKKGLEAAARDARYGFFAGLDGKIATAHTADDNAETVLMHLVRGTGLKGLGGIAPRRGNIIRPMLSVTRQEVLAFLEAYHLPYREDSSNRSDDFLRNRLRHHVMPLLRQENPSLAENLSAAALRLRQDSDILENLTAGELPAVSELRTMAPSLRSRYLSAFLERSGVKEPEAGHVMLAEKLVFSPKPSARANFPGNVVICRNYDRLEKKDANHGVLSQILPCPGQLEFPLLGLRIHAEYTQSSVLQWDTFTVYPQGEMVVRTRQPGDSLRLKGGTKSLKALLIDKKIPADRRASIPVVADAVGVLGVWGIGANLNRTVGSGSMVQIRFETINK